MWKYNGNNELRSWMSYNNISSKELAELLGLKSARTINTWTRKEGYVCIPNDKILVLANELGFSLNRIYIEIKE